LAELAATLALPIPAPGEDAADVYKAEEQILGDYRVIPLLHVPEVFAVGPDVRGGPWGLADVWLDREEGGR
jgi:hypothetical protein